MASKDPPAGSGISKENLLKRLTDIENEIKQFGDDHDTLRQGLEDLREKVERVLEDREDEIRNLRDEIQKLRREVESLKSEKKENAKTLALAEATWAWEAHFARFVVDSSEKIYPRLKYRQMEDYLKKKKTRKNLKHLVYNKIARWTQSHWDVVNDGRDVRKNIAHPKLFNLDLVESVIQQEMNRECQERMRDMLKILKTTASLMKFGRLATKFAPAKLKRFGENALNVITSWDRNFEDIDGLLNIEHDEAKTYVDLWVNNREIKAQCGNIVDFIKAENTKRLGKLAWKIEERLSLSDAEDVEALQQLKDLHPSPDDDCGVLGAAVATLHVPDFLPKRLWGSGIKIMEEYFNIVTPL